MIRALGFVVMVLAVWPAAAAAAGPEPGPWTAAPSSAAGTRALVSFTVDAGSGLLQPTVRYRLGRCGRLSGVGETVRLGLAARAGGRFLVVDRHRLRRHGIVRLRLAGRFDSAFEAHGVLRGRISLRGRPACRLPALSWDAESAVVVPVDDAVGGELEEELDIDDCEGCDELIEDDEEPIEDEEP